MNTARGILALVVLAIVGVIGYQIGVSQNIAVQAPAGAMPMAYGYPYMHWGFGFFGFLFPLFFLFLFFGLLRAAFGHGRGWGDHGHGPGMHGGWGNGRERLEALHRELHGEKPTTGTPPGGPSGPPA